MTGKNFCKVDHKWCKFCKRGGCTYTSGFSKDLSLIRKCPKREESETVTFRSLLYMCSFFDIMAAIEKYWPNERKNEEGYRKLYVHLLNIKGVKTNMFIHTSIHTFDNGNCPISSGVYLHRPQYYYALDFNPWNEIVNMNIMEETVDAINRGDLEIADVVAGTFYEMTFNGFNELKIRQKFEDMLDELDKEIHK